MRHLVLGITIFCSINFFALAGYTEETLFDKLGSADITKGKKLFRKCKSCHSIKNGGKNKIGPNLFDIVDRPVATREGFKYSKAFTKFGGNWSLDRLDVFLEKPKAAIKGTKMNFSGLKKPIDRLNLLAYLNTQSDSFSDDVVTIKDIAIKPSASDNTPEFGVLFQAPGVEETFYTCSVCHSERIIAQQGLTRSHWDELLVWMVEEQEMEKIEESHRVTILDYLATNYGEDRPNFPK